MDKQNRTILTVSFLVVAVLTGYTLNLLIKIFAGAFGVVARAADSDLVRHGVPVLTALVIFLVLQFNPKVRTWAEEVLTEVRKVVFPSQKDTTLMTISVMIMVGISTVIIWTFDLFSSYVVKFLMR